MPVGFGDVDHFVECITDNREERHNGVLDVSGRTVGGHDSDQVSDACSIFGLGRSSLGELCWWM